MRVFVIGAAVAEELIAADHQVLGLARSGDTAAALAASGAKVLRGSLEDPASLKHAAAGSDGVIPTAFNHDFPKFVANCEDDRRIIGALGAPRAGNSMGYL